MSEDHPAHFIISCKGIPLAFADVVEAARLLCAEYFDTSIPACWRTVFTYLAMVAFDTGALGLIKRNSSCVLLPLRSLVLARYKRRCSTTHNFLSCGNCSSSKDCKWCPGLVCLTFWWNVIRYIRYILECHLHLSIG